MNTDSWINKMLDEWGRNFEPATSTRGQGGLPVTGTVTDWQLTISKDGWQHHRHKLKVRIKQAIMAQRIEDLVAVKADFNLDMEDELELDRRIAEFKEEKVDETNNL